MEKQITLKMRWQGLGLNAQKFAALLKPYAPQMTESRLYLIAQGRIRPTDVERDVIAKLLGHKPWEINL